MRLEVKEWTSKTGKTGKTIKVGKMGARGYGMIVGEEIEFECVFAPKLQEVDWTDPTTNENKTFMSINVLATPLNHLDFFTPHLSAEYGNVQLQLPNTNSILQAMDKAEMGERYKISLVEFVSQKDGKTYVTFNCDQLNVIKKTEEPEAKEEPKVVEKPAVIVHPDYKAEPKVEKVVEPKVEKKAPETTDATDDDLPWAN